MRRRCGRMLHRPAAITEEDVDPNSHITNIADCMLVLVLGLLVALVARFGMDLTQSDENQIIGIEVNMDADGDGEIDGGYEQAGTVYHDPATGQYYLVQD